MDDFNAASVSAAQLSRRSVLKAGGALVVGFAAAPVAAAAQGGLPPGFPPDAPAPRIEDMFGGGPQPDSNAIDSWIIVHPDNTATVLFGHKELGQGLSTTMLQVAAEELDLDLAQVKSVSPETGITPNQLGTIASMGIARGSVRVRQAAAEARQALLGMASQRLGVAADRLEVAKGVVSVAGDRSKSVTYGQLIGDRKFNVAFTGRAPIKNYRQHKLVGTRALRRDIPAKAAGTHLHVQHFRLPGMLHGRVVRPRGQGAYGHVPKILTIDADSIRDIPGARIVRRGDFLGVVAPKEWDAIKAAQRLRVTWDEGPALPESEDALFERMRSAKTSEHVVLDRDDVRGGFAQAAHVVSSRYETPYQVHGTMAPNCTVADVKRDSAFVASGVQALYGARAAVALAIGLPPEKVTVRYIESSGTFGTSCHTEVAVGAAIMSQEAGAPVRLQFMRWDEHGWAGYQGAHIGEVKIACDAAGKILAYEYQGWQHQFNGSVGTTEMAGLEKPGEWPGVRAVGPGPFSAGDMYTLPRWRLVHQRINNVGTGYLRGTQVRSPFDVAVAFSSEQTIDELAHKIGMDPYLFRRQNINGERWLGVLEAVAKASKWTETPRRAASRQSSGRIRTGRGIALSTHLSSYGAAVAEIDVDTETGIITVKHMYGAVDCGQCINPGVVESQIVGQMCQAASRTLKEAVTFNTKNVTSLDWTSYPVLRFAEAPQVTPIVVMRQDQAPSGAGEEALAAGGAAIANAFFDATGVRLRRSPLVPARVLAALKTKTA